MATSKPTGAGRNPKIFAPILLLAALLAACAPAKPIPAQTLPATCPATAPTTAPVETAPPPEAIPWQEPEDAAFVRVLSYLPDAFQQLPYATEDNFTGTVIYDFSDAWLRYGTVKKLMQVQQELAQQGYSLLIWDGFRPTVAQWKLWEVCPDSTYVSDPRNGYSSHSRGNTVDVTLVYRDGTAVEMPTGFDDFTHYADRDYADCPQEAADNARLLENTMKKYGFSPYFGEWWHFSDTDSYAVAEDFQPLSPEECLLGKETALFSRADLTGDIQAWLQPGEAVTLLASQGDYFLAEARGGWGYILAP